LPAAARIEGVATTIPLHLAVLDSASSAPAVRHPRDPRLAARGARSP
jgi:hypothetical protein